MYNLQKEKIKIWRGYVGTLVISDVGLKVKVYDYAKTNPKKEITIV